jgi:hypothetical protein
LLLILLELPLGLFGLLVGFLLGLLHLLQRALLISPNGSVRTAYGVVL